MGPENSQIIRQHTDPLEFVAVNLMKPVMVDIQQWALPGMTKPGTNHERNYHESQGRFHSLACAPA